MHKLKYKLLPNIFQSLPVFKNNNIVHSSSTWNKEAYHCT